MFEAYTAVLVSELVFCANYCHLRGVLYMLTSNKLAHCIILRIWYTNYFLPTGIR